ncbi:MAG TPA: sensor histidine kinase [Candidatus Merdenecus merdavium]|nr:sensor histidine kinase [Candidatus Merdenecus merdavium]
MKDKWRGIIFRFKSIQTTILLSFFLLILTSLFLFFFISLNYTQRAIIKNSTDYTEQLVRQLNGNMDSYIHYMENISEMITRNHDVKDYFMNQSNIKKIETRKAEEERIVSQFQTILNTRTDIRNIGLIDEKNNYILNRGNLSINPHVNIEKLSWYQQAKEEKESFALSVSHIQNIILNNYDWVITLSRAIVDENQNILGVFFIDMNYNSISDLCQSVALGEKGYVYVLDQEGNIIYHPQQQLLYSGLKHEEIEKTLHITEDENSFIVGKGQDKKVYTATKSQKTGWMIVGVSYMSELMKERENTQIIYGLVTLGLLGGAILLAVFLSKAITKPIKVLDASMKRVEKGEFKNARIPVERDNEIGRLSNSFNVMTMEIQSLMEQNTLEQKQKRKAQMKALQAQIHPHFLYNTLDSIIWMAESRKHHEEVVLMTSSLAKLLRKSIGNDEDLVTIDQEVDYIKTYLTIQAIRYRDTMEYHIHIDEDIRHEKVVKFTLQPLVENAIYHGLKYIEEKGMIQIRGFRDGDVVILEVIDNGIGMDEEELRHIYEQKEPNQKSNGVGIYNVQNRLQLYFGGDYGLTFQSVKGEGTMVTVRIPLLKEGGVEDEKV